MPRPTYRDRQLHEAIGGRVRAARRRKGWSQEELAERLGVQPETCSRYETGSVPLSMVMLFRIAAALDVRPSALIDPEPEPVGTGGEPEVVRCWRTLDNEGQDLILNLLRRLVH